MTITPSTELLDASRAVARAWRHLNEGPPFRSDDATSELQLALDNAIMHLEDVALREEL